MLTCTLICRAAEQCVVTLITRGRLLFYGKACDIVPVAEQLLDLHRGQGMDIYWRDSYTCPSEAEYEQMVIKSKRSLTPLFK